MEEVLNGHSDTLASSRDPTDYPCGWTISFPLSGGIWWNDPTEEGDPTEE